MVKIINWLWVNGATLIGVLQAIVKAVKELLTGVVNLLSLFMSEEAAEKAVKAVRGAINLIDDGLQKIKDWVLK
jgi:hypothetical protein